MSTEEKLEMLRTILGLTEGVDLVKIKTYLKMAGKEILAWRYSYASEMPEEVPPEYEMTQIYAVVAGFGQEGAENQRYHSENGILSSFIYADMVTFIRSHVIPLCKVL